MDTHCSPSRQALANGLIVATLSECISDIAVLAAFSRTCRLAHRMGTPRLWETLVVDRPKTLHSFQQVLWRRPPYEGAKVYGEHVRRLICGDLGLPQCLDITPLCALCPNVIEVSLSSLQLLEDDIQVMGRHYGNQLRRIEFCQLHVIYGMTPLAISHFRNLSIFKAMDDWNTRMSDDVLLTILENSAESLEELVLHSGFLADASLERIAKAETIRKLDILFASDMSLRGLQSISENSVNLTKFAFNNGIQFRRRLMWGDDYHRSLDRTIADIIEHNQQLDTLELRVVPIAFDSVIAICNMKNLTSLTLQGYMSIEVSQMTMLIKSIGKTLEHLHLINHPKVRDDALRLVPPHCSKLKRLVFRGMTAVTGESWLLPYCLARPRSFTLSIEGCPLIRLADLVSELRRKGHVTIREGAQRQEPAVDMNWEHIPEHFIVEFVRT